MKTLNINDLAYVNSVNDSAIITNGLVLCLDFGNPNSYTPNDNIVRNLGSLGGTATLINTPTYNTGIGYLSFNGTNQYLTSQNLNLSTTLGFSFCMFLKQINPQPNSAWDYFYTANNFQAGTYGTNASGFLIGNVSTNTYQASDDIITDWGYISFGSINGNCYMFTANRNGITYVNGLSFMPSGLTLNFDKMFYHGVNGSFYDTYYRANCGLIQAYNRILSSDELTHNFNALKGRFGY